MSHVAGPGHGCSWLAKQRQRKSSARKENRKRLHSATCFTIFALGVRFGLRRAGVGERPLRPVSLPQVVILISRSTISTFANIFCTPATGLNQLEDTTKASAQSLRRKTYKTTSQ